MSTGKHYFIEENEDGKFAVREADAQRAASLHESQEEAVAGAGAKRLNPENHPNVWSASAMSPAAAAISGDQRTEG